MPKTIYLANKILDHFLGGPDYARPATVYLALYTVSPTPTGSGGTEVPGGGTGYVRLAVTNNSTNFPASSGGQKTNGILLDWGTATTSWFTIVAIAGLDASSGGNMMFYGPLSTPITVGAGQPFQVAAGSGVFTES